LDDTGLYGFANSHGLSIYFPINNDYDPEYSDYKISNIDFAQTQWDEFLSDYFTKATKYTIETLPISGSRDNADTYIALFIDNDGKLNYIWENDDISQTNYFSKIITPLASYKKYYILCFDYWNDSGYYAISVHDDSYSPNTSNIPSTTIGEPDDYYNSAQLIHFNSTEGRYLDYQDKDWMYFIMP